MNDDNPHSEVNDCEALTALVVDCPELGELEDRLGGFNLFDILGVANAELRHSNTLAWLLDPTREHGLDDLFLQNWLIRVVHESEAETANAPSPVEIDTWELATVEVRREWRQIDLLLLLTLADGEQSVVCIENKVGTTQHSDQLRRYRRTVENEFPRAAHQLFIFLTRDEESPEDEAYLASSYAQVAGALRDGLQRRRGSIGDEPRLLMENYLRLLEERFMNDSEIARLARSIYRKHRRAIDVILEHRPDGREALCETLQELARQTEGVLPAFSTKSYFRFLPDSWDTPKNRAGNAWGAGGGYVVLEIPIPLRGSTNVKITVGKPPRAWYQRLFERTHEPPFAVKRRAQRDDPKWFIVESFRTGVSIDLESDEPPEEQAERLWRKVSAILAKPDVKERIAVIGDLINELPNPGV